MAVLLVMAFVFVWAIPIARAEERMRVLLDIRNSVVTSPSVLASALREATSIWAPHGVAIDRAAPEREPAGEHGKMFVPVTFQSARAGGYVEGDTGPLGWTGFAWTGGPPTQISIFYDIVAIAGSGGVLFGFRDMRATILQDRLLGRVLGRTLAHEVGHVVLSSPDHSPSGLMRAAQSVPELQHPSRAGFGLDERDIARLRRLLDDRTRVAIATQR